MNMDQLNHAFHWMKSQRRTLLLTLPLFLFSSRLMAAESVEALAQHEASGLFGFLFTYIAHNPFVFLFLSIAIG